MTKLESGAIVPNSARPLCWRYRRSAPAARRPDLLQHKVSLELSPPARCCELDARAFGYSAVQTLWDNAAKYSAGRHHDSIMGRAAAGSPRCNHGRGAAHSAGELEAYPTNSIRAQKAITFVVSGTGFGVSISRALARGDARHDYGLQTAADRSGPS